MPFATTPMDLEIILLNKVSQRKTNITWYHLCESKGKNDTNELHKTETGSQTLKTNLWLTEWKGGGEG